jgi:RHS repeat-associated protein
MGYDADSSQLSVYDPNDVGQVCVYDARNRKAQCTDTHGDVNQWTYDANSNQLTFTDNKGQSDLSFYDARDRQTSYTSRLTGDTTAYVFDANGNTTSTTDAQSGVTAYTYDARNLKTQETYPDGGSDVVNYTYDAAHRPSSKLDQAGNTIGYAYDMSNRLTTRSYPDSNNDSLTYDLASRMLTAVSTRYSNTVTRTYDSAGRLTADNLTVGANAYNVGFAFDNANRNTGITYPDASAVTRSYTPRNLLSEVDYIPNGGALAMVAQRTYDAGMRLSTTTYGNSLVETRSYRNDPGGKIDNMIASVSTPSVTGFTYTYDANKNKITESDSVIGNYSWSTGPTGYDAKDRLTNWSQSTGNTQTWALSTVGDWTNTVVNGTTDNRTYNAVHELQTRSTSATALAYDLKGNLTTNWNGQTYTWDFDDHMASATVGGTTTNYAYDALGRRVSKATGTTTTLYVSALQQEVAEYVGGTLARKFVFGDYIDEPLMMVNVSGTIETSYYYHANALYCVSALTDINGNIVERYEYNPYGKVTISTNAGPDGIWFTPDDTYASFSALGNPFLYTGRRLEPETGLYYYRARCYDPDSGRFVARDLLEYADGMSLYQYLQSNPMAYFDPLGLAGTAPGPYPPMYGRPGKLPRWAGIAFLLGAIEQAFDEVGAQANKATIAKTNTYYINRGPCVRKQKFMLVKRVHQETWYVWRAEVNFLPSLTDKGFVKNETDEYYDCCCSTNNYKDSGWVNDPGYPMTKTIASIVVVNTLADVHQENNSQTETETWHCNRGHRGGNWDGNNTTPPPLPAPNPFGPLPPGIPRHTA